MARRLSDLLTDRAVLAVTLFGSGLVLEVFLMVRRTLWLHGIGPICGVHPASLHCPGCYAALSLILAAVAVVASPPLEPVRASLRSPD